MTTTRLPAQAQIVVEYDGDPFTVTVTHHDTTTSGPLSGPRNTWRWEIRSTTDAADWQPVREWSGTDLSSAIDAHDPDPIAALVSLGSFLGAYAEAVDYAERTGREAENVGLFPATLPPDLAGEIAERILLDFPEDEGGTCAACGDPFDRTHGNLEPVWSDAHDNMIHWICQPQPVDPGCGSTSEG